MAVVSHGGSGTVVAALAAGVPCLLLPLGADQPWNADRCVALGVGRALDAVTSTPAEVREALGAVLQDPSYRVAAEALRPEVAALPGPERAADELEDLAGRPPAGPRSRTPVTTRLVRSAQPDPLVGGFLLLERPAAWSGT